MGGSGGTAPRLSKPQRARAKRGAAGSIPAAPTNFDAACSSLNSCNRHTESGSNRRPSGLGGHSPPPEQAAAGRPSEARRGRFDSGRPDHPRRANAGRAWLLPPAGALQIGLIPARSAAFQRLEHPPAALAYDRWTASCGRKESRCASSSWAPRAPSGRRSSRRCRAITRYWPPAEDRRSASTSRSRNRSARCSGRSAASTQLVSAAGDAKFAPLAQLTDADFQFSMSHKLMGQVNLVRYGMEAMNDGGSFTVTTGILARRPMKGSARDQPRQLRVGGIRPRGGARSAARNPRQRRQPAMDHGHTRGARHGPVRRNDPASRGRALREKRHRQGDGRRSSSDSARRAACGEGAYHRSVIALLLAAALMASAGTAPHVADGPAAGSSSRFAVTIPTRSRRTVERRPLLALVPGAWPPELAIPDLSDRPDAPRPFRAPRRQRKNDSSRSSLHGALLRTKGSTILAGFHGFSDPTVRPPDPVVAAGPDHVVVAVNGSWGIYTKAGTRVFETTAFGWFLPGTDADPERRSLPLRPTGRVRPAPRPVDSALLRHRPDVRVVPAVVGLELERSDRTVVFVGAARRRQRSNRVRAPFADFPMLGYDDTAIYVSDESIPVRRPGVRRRESSHPREGSALCGLADRGMARLLEPPGSRIGGQRAFGPAGPNLPAARGSSTS